VATQVRKTKTVDRILDAAADLFYLHGLRGVGIEQVIERSGVAKSTLYVHFRTKEELVAEYLRRTDESWRSRMREAAEAAGPDPADQLVGLFDALLDAFDRHGFFGCPFVSAAVETTVDSQARAIAVAHTQRRHDWLAELCQQAGAPDPQSLARQVGLLVEGALAAGRLLQDRTVVDDAKRSAARLVRSHVGLPEPVAAPG
jgi:AcrR family transcriptional regulator